MQEEIKNKIPATSTREFVIWALNCDAERFEDLEINSIYFKRNIDLQLAAYLRTDRIDRIEERILRDQAIDIAEGEYTRFQDPENFMPPIKKQNNE